MIEEQATDARKREAFLPKLVRVAFGEFEALISRHSLSRLAERLPQQTFTRTRTELLRRAGMRIGRQSFIQGPIRVTGEGNPCEKVSIGTYTIASGSMHLDVGAPIRIGDRVRIGHDVSLLTVDHAVGSEWMRCGNRKFGEIEVGDGCWIASRVVVLPGVTIGAGAIVAAGAVVTRSVPPNSLVAGIPARLVRSLSSDGPNDDEPPASAREFVHR